MSWPHFFSRETSGFVPLNQTARKTIPSLILKSSNGGGKKVEGKNLQEIMLRRYVALTFKLL